MGPAFNPFPEVSRFKEAPPELDVPAVLDAERPSPPEAFDDLRAVVTVPVLLEPPVFFRPLAPAGTMYKAIPNAILNIITDMERNDKRT